MLPVPGYLFPLNANSAILLQIHVLFPLLLLNPYTADTGTVYIIP